MGHPYISHIYSGGDYLLGGEIELLQKITYNDGLDQYVTTTHYPPSTTYYSPSTVQRPPCTHRPLSIHQPPYHHPPLIIPATPPPLP